MRLGFNHNVKYRGEVYHVQTEDSGIDNPHVITLLYRGGTILASKKSTYHDILSFENRDEMVDEMMKNQHKGMLRSLKNGEFDQIIAQRFGGVAPQPAGGAERGLQETLVDLFGAPPEEKPAGGEPVDDIDDLITLLEVEVKDQKKEARGLDDAVLDFFSLK